MTTEVKDYTYHDELGPIIEVPIKLRIPKVLYEVWQDITTKYVGWDVVERKDGFEADLNWALLRLYIGYLTANKLVFPEHLTSGTLDRILKQHGIDTEFLDKADGDAGYVEALLLNKMPKDLSQSL